MKIKKYRPNFFSGFEDVYYDVNSKEDDYWQNVRTQAAIKYCLENLN